MALQHVQHAPLQRTGTAAAISGIAAVIGYIAIFTGHPFWGMLACGLAVLLGLAGWAAAASPRVSGAWIAIAALIFGLLGLVLSVVVAIGVIVF